MNGRPASFRPAMAVALALLVVAPTAALFLHGCRAIESGADAIAGATRGTPVSGLFSGVARAAESMRDYYPSEKHYIGRSVGAEILSQFKVHPDQKLQDYVNLVGNALLAAPEVQRTLKGYHFVVLQGTELQAVSAPGGFVFLTEGTVRRARDEDELAAVLAHELAHVTLDHGIKAIKAATRKKSVALLMQSAGEIAQEASRSGSSGQQQVAELASVFGNAIQDITGDLLVKGYSRESELEADQLAIKILQSAGYTRAALNTYLQHVSEEKSGGKGGWFGTHPSPEDRVAALGDQGPAASTGRDLRKKRFAQSLGG